MGELLVVADDAARRVRARGRGGGEARLERRVARAEQRELAPLGDELRQRLQQKIEAFLIREARDHAEERPVRARGEAHPGLERGLVAHPHVDAERAVGLRQRGVGGRIPDRVVDAVDDALDDGCAGAQQPIERHAEFRRHDLACVGRRDGGDAVGQQEAGFQIADAAEIFDPIDRQGTRGQTQLGEDRGRKVPLERDVVDRDRCPGTRAIRIMQIGGSERRLPVMGVNDLRPEGVDRAEPDVGADASQRREPARIVGPVEPVRAEVGIAGPVEEMGGVDREQAEFRGLAGDDARRAAEEIGILMRRRSACELGHDRGVAGDERPHLDAFAGEGGGERAGDVGEPPGFDQGEDLRGD
jgi:hypothetical protein